MARVEVELKHCDLEINYIGTRYDIAWAESYDILENFSNTIRIALAKALKNAAKRFDEIAEVFEKIE